MWNPIQSTSKSYPSLSDWCITPENDQNYVFALVILAVYDQLDSSMYARVAYSRTNLMKTWTCVGAWESNLP